MKRLFLILSTIIYTGFCQAQIVANDSAHTGNQSDEMTFYSLRTGQKTTVSNTDWHIALSVRASQFPLNTLQGTTIRINEAWGVKAYQIPGFTADSFNIKLDTAGYHNWLQLHDSDTSIDMGALNNGLNISVYNYGWGVYGGPPNHDVVGTKVFLFELPGGALKKFWVEQLDRDTAWVVNYANPDNSDFHSTRISKAQYLGKNLVYLDMLHQVVHDKEPLSAEWDLLFTRYTATDVVSGKFYPAVGVLQNKGRTMARRAAFDVLSNDYSMLTFATRSNVIGWNWKYAASIQAYLAGKNFTFQNTYYFVTDSLSFFARNQQGDVFKLIFTAYDLYTGKISFYQEQMGLTSALPQTQPNIPVALYPVPAQNQLNVQFDNNPNTTVLIYDMLGHVLISTALTQPHNTLNIETLPNGLYTLQLLNEQQQTLAVKKFTVAR
ncbi:MAG: T9SS type A sorting domain-containing protein [Chitinophagales bacterium]